MTNVAVPPAEKLAELEPGPSSSELRRRRPVLGFLLRRVVGGVITLIAVSILIFVVLQVLPGNVASAVLGRTATRQAIDQLQHQLGFDQPLITRYLHWVGNLLKGNLGNSATALAAHDQNPSVWSAISTPLRNSAILAGLTVVLLIPLSLVLGALAAVRARKFTDNVISTTSLALGSMPEFLIGMVLIAIFFSWLNVLPPVVSIGPGETPFDHTDQLVMPVVTLLSVSVAFTTRMVRAGTIDVLQQDYVAMARLNGIREQRVVIRYALRNALAPSVQALAQTVTYLAGGIIITESVFNYPGIGVALVRAVNVRDVPTVAAITLLLAIFYVTVNIIADLVALLLVPKLRTSL